MLNPRAYPLHQESNRLQVGDFVVDLPRRELTSASSTAHAEPVRLTVKAMHVLLALVGQHGKVVSREALLEWVWPDTMPTDDVLTQAIGQLRKAFCDDRDSPRYLETIPKGGYRLLASVQWLDGDEVVASTLPESTPHPKSVGPDPAPGRPPRRTRLAMLGTVLTLATLAGAFWSFSPQDPSARVLQPKPISKLPLALPFVTITSRPGRETNASVSPDGSMVAYVQVDEKGIGTIMLQATAHVPARALTSAPVGSSDMLPVWSPDGRTLAFTRHDAASRCQLLHIAASGGNERKLADCFAGMAASYDWTPDGSGLLMGLEARLPGERSSPLRKLDIATGTWSTLNYAIADNDIDIDPRYSPDGRWIVFRRSISLSDLWKMPATGGTPQRLTQVKSDIRGWDWLPDSSGLIFSYVGSDLGLLHYDMATGATTSLGIAGISVLPDIARHSPTLAFTVEQSTSGLFRFTLPASASGKVRKERVFSSSRSDLLGALSPNGRTLAFISDRGSRLELWLAELDQPGSARAIAGLMPVARHVPVWSEDGTRLLVIGGQSSQQTLHEVEVESGRVHVLPVPAPSPIYASYLGDASRLLVGSDSGDGRLRAVLYDRSHSPWRELATLQDVALARYDALQHKVYFTRVTKPGTWSASPDLQKLQVVDPDRPHLAREYKRWDIGPDGPYFLSWSKHCATGWIRMAAPAAQSGLCLDTKAEAWPLAPSVARDGKSIFVTLDVSSNADIGLADLTAMTSGTAFRKMK